MSSNCRGDSSFLLSAVNVKKLDRSTSGAVYLKHIISQWTQLQSKLHAGLQRKLWVQAGRMRGLHASLTMLLLAVSHGYILCMNFKMGDIFGVKYPFWICATILNKYVHVFLVTSQIRWYQFQVVIEDYSRQKALKRWEPITQATGLLGPLQHLHSGIQIVETTVLHAIMNH